MESCHLLRILVLLLSAIVASPLCQAAEPDIAVRLAKIADASNDFGFEALRTARADEPGETNLVLSPLSITSALVMTYAGARGDTAAEIAAAAPFADEPAQLSRRWGELLSALGKHEGEHTLCAANRLWGAKGYEYLPPFLDVLRSHLGAELFVLDFQNEPQVAKREINAWIAEQTAGRIDRLGASETINRDTLLLITSAVAFHGAWTRSFLPQSTVEEPFGVGSTKHEKPMMRQTNRFYYAEDQQRQLLAMPYRGERVVFVAALPKKPDGLADLERTITAASLRHGLAQLKPMKVDVAIPRFTTSTNGSLKKTLVRLGVRSAFSPAADLSGITGKSNLYLQDVNHQAYLHVDEVGTEAAAITTAFIGKTAIEPDVVFHANRPFLFFVVDQPTGTILFMGRLAQ